MPCTDCTDIEIRVGLVTIDRGDAGDPLSVGNVQLITYGGIKELHKIPDPVRNVTQCTKEFYSALYAVFTFDCSAWEVWRKYWGITPQTVAGGWVALPTDVSLTPDNEHTVYLLSELGGQYAAPYQTVTFATTPNAGVPDLTENTDYQFGHTDGSFIVEQADPSGIDGVPIYVQSGNYTDAAGQRYRFDDTAANTNATVTYTHVQQDGNGNTVLYMPTAFVTDVIEITDTRDELRQFQVRYETLWDASASGYELGYIQFGT